MKRVYYSGFIPVNPYDKRLPALDKAPLVRENRLYQADWLMRFYGFRADEIADSALRASIWRSTPSWPGPCGIPNFSRSMSTAPTTRCCCACRASGSSRPG